MTVDYDDEASLISALQGQDFLVVTLALGVPEDTHRKLNSAAAKAGVRFVLANAYGIDLYGKESLKNDLPVGKIINDNIEHAAKVGLTWFALFTGPWYEHSLSYGPDLLGVDKRNRTFTFFDDGKTPVNFTTIPQLVRAAVALIGLKKLPDSEQDDSPCLSRFYNKPVYVSSFQLNQEQVLQSIQRVTGQSWNISHESSKERYEDGMKKIAEGDMAGFGKAIFARNLFPNGDGIYDTANNVLGLPAEDLDEATRLGLEYA